MATNIKDRCPPWNDDPGKMFLTLRAVKASASGVVGEVLDGFTFPRKVHVTNLRLVCTQAGSAVAGATVSYAIKKGTTAVLSCAISNASTASTITTIGMSFKGTETQVEFLTSDEMTVYVKTKSTKVDGEFLPIVEYEQA